MLRTVMHNGQPLEYELTVKKVKNMNLRVSCGKAALSINRRVPVKAADAFVLAKAPWVLRCLEQQRTAQQPPRRWENGECIQVLGRPLVLWAEKGAPGVRISGDCLLVTARDPEDILEKQRLVARFLDNLCKETFHLLLKRQHTLVADRGVPMPQLRVKTMTSRWGSCIYQKGVVTLNRALIQTPPACIEYVVLHELAHFLQPNHSKAFYAEIAARMPDYRERVALLKQYAPGNK